MKSLAVAVLLLGATARAADEPPRPLLLASVHLSPFTAFPELLGASVTVHAIPWVDVAGGVSGGVGGRFGWWVRGGPRLMVADLRDEQHRGLTWRLALHAGYRAFRDARADAAGFSGLFATDFAHFFAPHFAFAVQLALGGLYDAPNKRVLPELRLGLGVAF
ncbi:MAG: hypothetical protein ACOZQL_03365 [Myxococcota bacterium]